MRNFIKKKMGFTHRSTFYTITPATNSNIFMQSRTSNLDFLPASGPIEARQFFEIQARARPEKLEPAWQLSSRENDQSAMTSSRRGRSHSYYVSSRSGNPAKYFSNGTTRNLRACSSHCSLNTERQAGKLRMPILQSLV